jgi:hypothetical protein
MSGHPEVILVVAQWSSTSRRASMFLLDLSILSYHVLNELSFLESEFLWPLFSLARPTKSPLLICGRYMVWLSASFVSSCFLLSDLLSQFS